MRTNSESNPIPKNKSFNEVAEAEPTELQDIYQSLEQQIGFPEIREIPPIIDQAAELFKKAAKSESTVKILRLFDEILHFYSADEKLVQKIRSQREQHGSAWAIYTLLNMLGQEGNPDFQAAVRFSHFASLEHPKFFDQADRETATQIDATHFLAARFHKALKQGFPWQNKTTKNYDIRLQPVYEAISDMDSLPIVKVGDPPPEIKTEAPAILDLSGVNFDQIANQKNVGEFIANQIKNRPFVIVIITKSVKNSSQQRSIVSMIANHQYIDGVPAANLFSRAIQPEQDSGTSLSLEQSVDLSSIKKIRPTEDSSQINGPIHLDMTEFLRVNQHGQVEFSTTTDTTLDILLKKHCHQTVDDTNSTEKQLNPRFIFLSIPIVNEAKANSSSEEKETILVAIDGTDITSLNSTNSVLALIQNRINALSKNQAQEQQQKPEMRSVFTVCSPTEEELKMSDDLEMASVPGSERYQVETVRLEENLVNKLNDLYQTIVEMCGDFVFVSYNDFLQLAILSYFGVDGNSIKGGILGFSPDPAIQLDHFEVGNAQGLLTALISGDKKFILNYLQPELEPLGGINAINVNKEPTALQTDSGGEKIKPNLGLYHENKSTLAVVRSLNRVSAALSIKLNKTAKIGVDTAISGQALLSSMPDTIRVNDQEKISLIGQGGPALTAFQDAAVTIFANLHKINGITQASEIILRVKMNKKLNKRPEKQARSVRDFSPYAKSC